MLTFLLGVMATAGDVTVAIAAAVSMTVLLALRTQLHGIVRLKRLAHRVLSGASCFRQNFILCLVITKQRDAKAAEIPRSNPSRSI